MEILSSIAPFLYSLPYQSAIPPGGCDIVPVTREEQLTKRGVPRTVKRSGLPFCSEWKHPECLMDKDQSQAENACLSVTPPVSPSGCLRPPPCRTEDPDRSRGSCLQLRPWRIWLYKPDTSVCVLSSCTSITALSFSSLRKYCVVVDTSEVLSLLCGSDGKWTSDEDKPGENNLRKKNAITVFRKCCECLLELAPRTSWCGFLFSVRAIRLVLVWQASSLNHRVVFDCI